MRHIKLLVFTITISLLINSCGLFVESKALKKMTVEKGAIPYDLGKDNTVLICILKNRKSRDKYIKMHIEKYYKGSYEFVLESEINLEKYKNTDKYKYLFDYKAVLVQYNSFNRTTNRQETTQLSYSNYFIYDRKSNKYYYSDVKSKYFSKLIKAYAINMEKVRQTNSN